MIRSQVIPLCLVKCRSQLQRVPLVREAEIRLGHVVMLLLNERLGPGAPNLEVMRLDRSNEVLVWWHNGLVWVSVWEKTTVSRYESVSVALSQLDRGQLRFDFANLSPFSVHPVTPLSVHCVIRRSILFVFWQAGPDFEVCHLILNRSVGHLLSSSVLAGSLALLETRLRVVNSVVFAKDEVGAAEFGDCGLALQLGVELSAHAVAGLQLLAQLDVCHFFLYCIKPLSKF